MRLREAALSEEKVESDPTPLERKRHIRLVLELSRNLSAMKEWKRLVEPMITALAMAAILIEEEKTEENLEAATALATDLSDAYLHLGALKEGAEWNSKALDYIRERSREAKETALSVNLRAACIEQRGECEYRETGDPASAIERLREAWNAEFEVTVKEQETFSIEHMLGMLKATEKYYGLLGRESEGEDYVLSRFSTLSERMGSGPWETLPEARAFRARAEREERPAPQTMPPINTDDISVPVVERKDMSSVDISALLSGGIGGELSDRLGDLSALMISEDVEAGKGKEEPAAEPVVEAVTDKGDDVIDERHEKAKALFAHATKGWLNNRKELREALAIWKELEAEKPSPEYEEWIEKTEKLV